MNFNAIIFDFDGVIIDSEPLHCDAFRTVLEPLGISFTWEEYLRDYVGFDDRDALRFAFSTINLDLDAETMGSLIRDKAKAFASLAAGPSVELYPGVLSLLDAYVGKLPIGICSGALLEDIEPVVERFNIRECFDVIITADQVEKSKPDPESYRRSIAALSERHGPLDPGRCVAIEDTPAGLASAIGAGCFTVGVAHTHAADILENANLVVKDLPELATHWVVSSGLA